MSRRWYVFSLVLVLITSVATASLKNDLTRRRASLHSLRTALFQGKAILASPSDCKTGNGGGGGTGEEKK